MPGRRTDPEFDGNEIGDLCAWNFGAPLGTTLGGEPYNQVINGHDYYLQQEWSNADGGCVQYARRHRHELQPDDPFYAGTGPLVHHGGPVMTTNTVYAIYWVPAAPANTARRRSPAPRRSAGRSRRSHGVWSNSPELTYRWLRCSAAGTSCHGIKKATDRTYKPVHADAATGSRCASPARTSRPLDPPHPLPLQR